MHPESAESTLQDHRDLGFRVLDKLGKITEVSEYMRSELMSNRIRPHGVCITPTWCVHYEYQIPNI